MRRNRKTIGCICVILTFLALFNIPRIWNSWFVMKRNDINEYLNNEYVNYNRGELAKEFFEEYVCLEEYIEADFHFCDGEKMIVVHNRSSVKTMYVLDVYYEEEFFNVLLSELTNDKQLVYLDQRNPFTGYGFEEYCLVNDKLKQFNSAASIFVDSRHNTIRYAFVYDEECGMMLALDIALTLNLPENSNEDDLIFEY